VITREREDPFTPFERGESKDHTCEKIFSFGCKMTKRQSKQNDAKFFRCY
jgi:hypothetical protein